MEEEKIELVDVIQATETTPSVSSTLDKNAKDYGKQHLVDGKSDTAWYSD